MTVAVSERTFRTFCESYGIKHVLNAVSSPRSNGQCKRYNKTIVMLSTMSVENESDKWDKHVKKVQSALNSSFDKSINTTRDKVLLGYQTKPLAEVSLLNSIKLTLDCIDVQELRGRIKEHMDLDQNKQ